MTPINNYVARIKRDWENPSWMIAESRTDQQIAARQHTTSGLITAHEPENHDQYVYKFEVGGKPYTGRQSPKADELSVGKQVIVFYDPQNPSRNALSDFHDVSMSAFGPVPMLCFAIGAVAVFIFYQRRRRTRPSESPVANKPKSL